MSRILDKHAPFKKLTKPGLSWHWKNLFLLRTNYFGDFINKKDLTQKTELHIKDRNRNMLSTLMKKVN